MITYDDVIKILEETLGSNKEHVIGLATIALDKTETGAPRPSARMVCAVYEDGFFYISTDARKHKMAEISNNPEVAICGFAWYTFNGIGENLGWVKAPENDHILKKFRLAFDWFRYVGAEDNENSIVLKVKLTKGTIVHNPDSPESTPYTIDLVNKELISK